MVCNCLISESRGDGCWREDEGTDICSRFCCNEKGIAYYVIPLQDCYDTKHLQHSLPSCHWGALSSTCRNKR